VNATLFSVHATPTPTRRSGRIEFQYGSEIMRKFMLALGCTAMVLPSLAITAAPAEAQRRYKYREWRDDRGRMRCRKPDGTTGLVVGGVAGALLGRTVDTGGDRTLGTLGGAAVGALAGRTVERETSKKCR
jgi:outer membrane lipoprotein SlyB